MPRHAVAIGFGWRNKLRKPAGGRRLRASYLPCAAHTYGRGFVTVNRYTIAICQVNGKWTRIAQANQLNIRTNLQKEYLTSLWKAKAILQHDTLDDLT